MIKLHNDYLKVEISAHGAEMQKLFSKETGIDYLWSGDKQYWGKFSPILFPIVGSLVDEEYVYNNETYKLSRHGFARDLDFEIEAQNNTSAVFTLRDTPDTLKIYPFKFELKVKYELIERKLVVSYQVINKDAKEIYFSIGAHPAFAVPNTNYEDYYLAFNEDEKLENWLLDEKGLLTADEQTILLGGHKLALKHELFYKDALVLKTLQSNCISLLNQVNEHGLHFHFEHFPFFGIWSAKDAPFVCLEPWCGVADHSDHNKILTEKEGIEKLAVGASFERFWEVECF